MSCPTVLLSVGSFNPITFMHLRLFELAKHHLKIKRNIKIEKGVISPTNDRYATIKPSLSPSHHRLAMIRLALKEIDWIVCDDWETRQPEWIRTLVALKHYESVYGKNLRLLCGADLIESFLVPNLWSDEHIEEILNSYGVVVLPRQGSNPWKLIYDSPKSDIFKRNSEKIDIIDDFCPIDISSTMVRTAVKEGKPIDHLVSSDVAKYIKDKGLYKY